MTGPSSARWARESHRCYSRGPLVSTSSSSSRLNKRVISARGAPSPERIPVVGSSAHSCTRPPRLTPPVMIRRARARRLPDGTPSKGSAAVGRGPRVRRPTAATRGEDVPLARALRSGRRRGRTRDPRESALREIVGCGSGGFRWGDHVTRSPRAAKLSGLVKPWATRRRT